MYDAAIGGDMAAFGRELPHERALCLANKPITLNGVVRYITRR
jgi:hypothetical protein